MKAPKRSVGRPKAPADTEIIQVRMTTRIANKLRGTPKGIGAEIRDRLLLSIEDDETDASTRSLLSAVRWIAEELRGQTAPWPTNERTQLALLTAIETWVRQTAPPVKSAAVSDLFGSDDPATLGRSVARHYIRFARANEATRLELKEAQQKREARNGKKA